MPFKVGQKVVCVRDYGNPFLRRGGIYTINGFGEIGGRESGVYLVETAHRHSNSAFYASRFRPLVERKTDAGMAILREILDRESHQDREPIQDKQLRNQPTKVG